MNRQDSAGAALSKDKTRLLVSGWLGLAEARRVRCQRAAVVGIRRSSASRKLRGGAGGGKRANDSIAHALRAKTRRSAGL